MELNELIIQSAIIAPIIFAFVQAVKKTNVVDAKYMPIIAALTGAAVVPFTLDAPIVLEIVAGIVTGFSATGLYEVGKTVVK